MRKVKTYYKYISVNVLTSALDYQRKLENTTSQNFIRNKIESFDPKKVNPPKVSLRIRNGKEEYRVVDGQHTIAIVKGIGWTTIRCEIKEDLSDEEENEWFYEINDPNNSRPQTHNTLLNSQINGKFNKKINKIINILDKVGYSFNTKSDKGEKGVFIGSVGIIDIYDNMSDVDFAKCMKIHSSIWSGDKKSMQVQFVKGFSKFYITYKNEIELDKFKRFTPAFIKKNITANEISRDVSNLTLKKNNDIKYAWVFAEHYNNGLSEDKKLKLSKLID